MRKIKNILCLILVLSLLCSCSQPQNISAAKTEPLVGASPSPKPSFSPEPSPTPEPKILEKIYLDMSDLLNDNLIIDNGDGTFTVKLTKETQYNDYNRSLPVLPSYIWHINPEACENVSEIVVEFDLLEVCSEENMSGYDMGYFAGITDADRLLEFPYLAENGLYTFMYDLDYCMARPYLFENIKRYSTEDNSHVTITVPIDQFITSARDIILQLLPGATYSDIQVYAQGYDISSLDISAITNINQLEYENSVIPYINEYTNLYSIRSNMDEPYHNFIASMDFSGSFRKDEIFLSYYNNDGSYKMVLSELDMTGYDKDIGIEYGTAPDFLFYPISYYGKNETIDAKIENLANFVYNNMRDEQTGLICGIWDYENQKHIAKDRTYANAPLLLQLCSFLPEEALVEMFNSIIEYEIEEIDGKYYYLPNGIEDNSALIKLSDLSNFGLQTEDSRQWIDGGFYGISKLIFDFLKNERITLKDAAIYTEAIANSLELILEAQENNPANLSADAIYVTFNSDGSHNIENTGNVFSADNYYYLCSQNARGDDYLNFLEFAEFYTLVPNRVNDDINQITTNMYLLGVYRNVNAVMTYEHKIILSIYDFMTNQDESTRFAPKYNVLSGEPIFYSGSIACPYLDSYNRFGSPKEFCSYMCIAEYVKDAQMIEELDALFVNFWYESRDEDFYIFGNNIISNKLNISLNKDLYSISFFKIYRFGHGDELTDINKIAWEESTGEFLINLYTRYGVHLTDEMLDVIEQWNCDTVY